MFVQYSPRFSGDLIFAATYWPCSSICDCYGDKQPLPVRSKSLGELSHNNLTRAGEPVLLYLQLVEIVMDFLYSSAKVFVGPFLHWSSYHFRDSHENCKMFFWSMSGFFYRFFFLKSTEDICIKCSFLLFKQWASKWVSSGISKSVFELPQDISPYQTPKAVKIGKQSTKQCSELLYWVF